MGPMNQNPSMMGMNPGMMANGMNGFGQNPSPMPTNMAGANPNMMNPSGMGFNQPFMSGPAASMMSPQQNIPVQPQQPQPQVQPALSEGFVGRVITDPSEIKANEVPMDGRVAMFLSADLQTIFLKAWSSNGGIMTECYRRDPTYMAPVPAPDTSMDDILRRLENLERAQAPKQGRTNKPQKGDVSNDANA